MFMTARSYEYPAVTVGVVNFNGKDVLPSTLHSILNQSYPDFQVLVVDNNSTDGSREWLRQWEGDHCPQIRCIFLPENSGSAAGRGLILKEAKTDYVFFVDNDILVNPDALYLLVEAMQKHPGTAACHPEICAPDDPYVYHYNGGWIHYLGVYISRERPGDPGSRPEIEVFSVTSGGALLVKREIALEVGGFDEDFFFNMEDGDFTARITLAGYLCVNVPRAQVIHNNKPRSKSKVFYQVRNRLFLMFKLYSWRTLLLSAPTLLLFELIQAAFLVSRGAGKDYFKANVAFISSLPAVLKKRKVYQKLKKLDDREWLRSGEMYVPHALVRESSIKPVMKLFGDLFALYWKLASRLS
jgi:GT2 family glycosyltransferase